MSSPESPEADPRPWQIAFLAVFLAFVLAFREFPLAPVSLAVIPLIALLTQAAFVRGLRLPPPGYRSALISSLSLCLLLRTNHVWVAGLAAFLAIASKFVLRIAGKHLFNPTNFGILATVLLTGKAWVSPAQWGATAWIAFFTAALGLAVCRRASRLDMALGYLGAHAALLFTRAWYLGERPEVVFHRLSSGALIVFAFFMITDPRATPDRRIGRLVFALLTALVAYQIQFRWFVPSAPLWALLVISPATPLLDRLWPSRRFEWQPKGVSDHVSPKNLAAA